MRSALKARLSRRRAWAFAVALGVMLASSSLTSGLAADDYFHKLVLTHSKDIEGIPSDAIDLFVWANGDHDVARAYMDVGMTGWWTDPDLVLAYWRPITAFTHWIDYQLWPESPFWMHVHSVLWFALGLYLLWHVYRRLMAPESSRWVAVLALLIFACDDAHGLTISWIANRNALVALCFALGVLLFHDRARRDGHRPSAWLGPVALAAALAAGESALGVFAYLFAFALFLDPAPRRAALLRLVPYALVVLAWFGIYYATGYGAHGSGLVADPVREPGRYLLAVVERLPTLLVAQVAIPPADLWEFYPVLSPWLPGLMLAWSAFVLSALAISFRPLLARYRTARFWVCGAVLCGLPACVQFPSDRLLLFVGVGAMGLIAQLVGAFIDRASWLAKTPRGRRGQATVAGALFVLHLVIAPLWLPFRARGPADITRMLGVADRTIEDTPGVRQKTVILMNPPADAFAGYIPTLRAATGRHRPRHLHWLATGASDLRIERVDANTLRVRPADGFLSLASELMQRSPQKSPMRVGYTVELSVLKVVVTDVTADGRPAEILARFAFALDDPRLVFLQWTDRGFEPFPLPEPGESTTLKAADFVSLFP